MSYYHQVLGVPANATKSQIKKAYRRLAKQYHPDRNKATNAAAKFDELTKAYDYLTQPQKRIVSPINFSVKRKVKRKYHNTNYTEEEINNIRDRVKRKRKAKKQSFKSKFYWFGGIFTVVSLTIGASIIESLDYRKDELEVIMPTFLFGAMCFILAVFLVYALFDKKPREYSRRYRTSKRSGR